LLHCVIAIDAANILEIDVSNFDPEDGGRMYH
jgi:hypothetical protein